MRLTIKPQDVLRSKIVEPGWYKAIIRKVVDAPARKDGSMNSEVYLEIVSLPDGTATPYAKVPITNYFNEKFPGFSIEFCQAMGGSVSETANVEFEIGPSLVGKYVDINVINAPGDNGRTYNNIKNFRPAAKAAGVPAA